ncbi:Lrp/AsnC family transcriptional regulator [Nonomuraea sp. CA-218870]|uniref:Lrp/AsnC family transcriptional regulator n=1 Tax=Nonomuraea sp. CA-218870 TaxID=3239998 RepID=UPI003D8F4127
MDEVDRALVAELQCDAAQSYAALDRPVLAYVMVGADAWMGESGGAFAGIPEITEAHVIAGEASVLVKVRTATTEQLQGVLRRIYDIQGSGGHPGDRRPGDLAAGSVRW